MRKRYWVLLAFLVFGGAGNLIGGTDTPGPPVARAAITLRDRVGVMEQALVRTAVDCCLFRPSVITWNLGGDFSLSGGELAKSGLLNLGNSRKLIATLTPLLDAAAIQRLEEESAEQTQLLFDLAIYHFRFARGLSNAFWRQRVSRLYYASYSASKCVRYFVHGEHSKEVGDHKKVGDLPPDFPQRALYGNQLGVLRDDRNSCDYDHDCRVADLVITQTDAQLLVGQFLGDVRTYVAGRGLQLRSAP